MTILKLTSVGDSTGIVLPDEMLEDLKASQADALCVIQTPNGYLLTPYNPDVEEELNLGRDFMKKYSDTFKALAK